MVKSWQQIHEYGQYGSSKIDQLKYYYKFFPELEKYVEQIIIELAPYRYTLSDFLEVTLVDPVGIIEYYQSKKSPKQLVEDFLLYTEENRRSKHILSVLSPTIY